MALDEDLRSIRTRISSAQAKKARAEVVFETAQQSLQAARSKLKEEFGVTTGAEAKEMLVSLTNELDDAVKLVRSELESAGA